MQPSSHNALLSASEGKLSSRERERERGGREGEEVAGTAAPSIATVVV